MINKVKVSFNRGIRYVLFFILTVLLGISFLICVNVIRNKNKNEIPKIDILLNNVSLAEINAGEKSIKYEGNVLFLDYKGKIIEIDDVELKGRGNMSWLMDKKSYRLKFPNRINLLSQYKAKKVVLISNSLDDTFLRNDLAHYVSRLIDERHPIKGDFVDLYVDGEYIGLYYLVQPIDIRKNIIDLRDPMGLIVEIDNAYCQEEEIWRITEIMKDCLIVEDAVEKNNDNINMAFDAFLGNYEMFEQAVLEGDFEKASEYADMNSWAEHYLIGEFAMNLDMAITSLKLYSDGPADEIHAVLAWDFDWSFGNRNWDDAQDPRVLLTRYNMIHEEKLDYMSVGGNCRFEMGADSEDYIAFLSQTICYLVDMPKFQEKVSELYIEKIKPKKQEIIDYIERTANLIRESARRDNEKWGKRDFDEEVEYLIWWVNERFDYFDEITMDGRNFFTE